MSEPLSGSVGSERFREPNRTTRTGSTVPTLLVGNRELGENCLGELAGGQRRQHTHSQLPRLRIDRAWSTAGPCVPGLLDVLDGADADSEAIDASARACTARKVPVREAEP
jgi:hypothetical protein